MPALFLEPPSLPPDTPPALLAALDRAASGPERAAAFLALARHFRGRALALALALAQTALARALEAGAALARRPGLTVEILSVLGGIEATQGRHERAFEHLALALDLAQEHGLRDLESRVFNNRAIVRMSTGDLVGARRDLEGAQALARRAADPVDLGHASVNLAYLENLAGDHAQALHQLNVLEELLASLPDPDRGSLGLYLHENRAHTLLNLAREARERGRPEAEAEARARTRAAIAATRAGLAERPDRLLALLTEAHAARLCLLEGRLSCAEDHALAALDHHTQLGQQSYLDAWLALAEVRAAQGQFGEAQQHYAAALASARAQQRHRETQDILRAVAGLYERQGDLAAALETLREALSGAQLALGRLAQIEGRHDDLARELRQARALAQGWQDSVRRAEDQARQDPLTGLLNRRGLHDALTELAGAGGAPLLLALFDIDDFKSVNDRHSHAVGDAALRAVALRLRAQAPAGSLLVRYGGEEFLLVVPGLPPAGAPALVEELRRAVGAQGWSGLPPGLHLTVSAGYAPAPGAGDQAFRTALEQADEQLYRAKRAGRNRVWPPLPTPVQADPQAGGTGRAARKRGR